MKARSLIERFSALFVGYENLDTDEAETLVGAFEGFLGREVTQEEAFIVLAEADSILYRAKRVRECISGKAVLIPRFSAPSCVGGPMQRVEPQFLGTKDWEVKHHAAGRQIYEMTRQIEALAD